MDRLETLKESLRLITEAVKLLDDPYYYQSLAPVVTTLVAEINKEKNKGGN